jgi:23S rRNA (guanosine2251-2'-O)-methyltransferase
LLLILDGVQDPHNLGACLRSAAAAGATAVIVPKDRAATLTPTARKVAAGGAERVPLVRVTNLARCMKDLQDAGIWIVGLAGEAEASLYSVDLKGPMAIAMGGEGEGLRRLTREHCDYLAKIPMASGMESLNVSVAAGISLFEALRQRA